MVPALRRNDVFRLAVPPQSRRCRHPTCSRSGLQRGFLVELLSRAVSGVQPPQSRAGASTLPEERREIPEEVRRVERPIVVEVGSRCKREEPGDELEEIL